MTLKDEYLRALWGILIVGNIHRPERDHFETLWRGIPYLEQYIHSEMMSQWCDRDLRSSQLRVNGQMRSSKVSLYCFEMIP